MELRPYQDDACARVLQHHAEGVRRVLLVAATGSGKTVMGAHLVRHWTTAGKRVVFVVHRDELVRQTAAKLEAFGVPHGFIKAGYSPDDSHLAQVASIQSLVRRTVTPADVLVFDEAHHAAADTYRKLSEKWAGAVVLGLTATPWRTDGRGLAGDFDVSVVVRQPHELQSEGYLAPLVGYVYHSAALRAALKAAAVQQGEFKPADADAAMRPRIDEVVAAYLARCPGQRALLFATGVQTSRDLCAAFVLAGVNSAHLDAETPAQERRETLDAFGRGQVLVLCNVGILTEGFDCPDASAVILARPTMSRGLFLQMVGRGLRPSPGKERCTIIDMGFNLPRHGHPYQTWDFSLQAPKAKTQKDPPPPAECKKCGAFLARPLHDGETCPECGWTKPVRERPAGVAFDAVDEWGNRPAGEAAPVAENWKDPKFRQQVFRKWNSWQLRGWLRKKAKATGSADVALSRLVWMSGGLLTPLEAEARHGAWIRAEMASPSLPKSASPW